MTGIASSKAGGPPCAKLRLSAITSCCGTDYGRVDLRVDDEGRVFVLEANANPCLDPGAGFAAAAGQAGLSYTEAVRELISFLQLRGRP